MQKNAHNNERVQRHLVCPTGKREDGRMTWGGEPVNHLHMRLCMLIKIVLLH